MKKRLLLSVFALMMCLGAAWADEGTEASKLYLDYIELENATMAVTVERDGSAVMLSAGDSVSVGETLTFTITANDGYYFSDGTTSKSESVTLTTGVVKTDQKIARDTDLTSSLETGDGDWSQLSTDNTYENATRTSGWKVTIPRTDKNEKTISVTMPSDGKLSFEYGVNNGYTQYGKFYVYLYINGEIKATYDELQSASGDYRRVYSKSGVSVSANDVVKWVIQRSYYDWADNNGRQGYIGAVVLTDTLSLTGFFPTLAGGYTTHQHSYGDDGKCTTCSAVHTYTLTTPTSDCVYSTVVTREGTTLADGAELVFGDTLTVTITPKENTVWSDDASQTGARSFEITVDNSDPNTAIEEKVALVVYPVLTGAVVDNATVDVTVTRDEQSVTLTNGTSTVIVGENLTITVTPANGYYFSDGTNAAKTFTVTLTSDMISSGKMDISSALTSYAVHQHEYGTDGKCTTCGTIKSYTLTIPTSTYVASTVVKNGDTELAAGATLTFGDNLTVIVTKTDAAAWSDDNTITDAARTFTITVGLTDPNDDIAAKVALAVCPHTSQTSGVCDNCGHYDALTNEDLVDGYYQLATAGNLMAFADIVNGTNGATKSTSAKAMVTGDIDFTSITSVSYTPIGNSSSNCYGGTFDGGNHTITLNINNSSSHQGLFGYTGYGTIKNVTVAGTVSGNYYVGGIVGQVYYATEIDNCTNKASVSGNYVGGIVGYNDYANLTITKCVNEGTVSGNSTTYIGGIVGRARGTSYSVSISNSANRGTIQSTSSYAGSLIGRIENKYTLTGCYNSDASTRSAIAVDEASTSTITRCYDINSTSSGTENAVLACTADEITSGALCYNLNGGVSDMAWYQKLTGDDADSYPVLTATDNEGNVVNRIQAIDGSSANYFNTPASEAEKQTVTNTDSTKFYVVDATTLAMTNISVDGTDNVNILVKGDGDNYTCANAVLVDAQDYAVPYAYTATQFTYDRTLATDNKGISTFMLPISVSASEVNGKVYKLSSLEDNTLNFEEVTGTLEANTPYIVENTTTSDVQKLFTTSLSNVSVSAMEAGTVSVSDGAAIHYGAYTTKTSEANGSDADISGKTLYGYADGKFIKAIGTWTLPAFHTMILVPTASETSNAPALGIDLGNGDTSGISSTAAEGAETVNVYSVSGVRLRTGVNGAKALNGLPAGIYVVNGKKLVKK